VPLTKERAWLKLRRSFIFEQGTIDGSKFQKKNGKEIGLIGGKRAENN
jgi:hypothetical protein